jgi:hypothetical protein
VLVNCFSLLWMHKERSYLYIERAKFFFLESQKQRFRIGMQSAAESTKTNVGRPLPTLFFFAKIAYSFLEYVICMDITTTRYRVTHFFSRIHKRTM